MDRAGRFAVFMYVYVCIKRSLVQMKSPSSPHPLSAVLLVFVLVPTGVRELRVPEYRTRSQG